MRPLYKYKKPNFLATSSTFPLVRVGLLALAQLYWVEVAGRMLKYKNNLKFFSEYPKVIKKVADNYLETGHSELIFKCGTGENHVK
jgi:hypothetical protein